MLKQFSCVYLGIYLDIYESRFSDYWAPSLQKILPYELSPDPATKGLRGDPGLCTWRMENLSVDLNVDSCEGCLPSLMKKYKKKC